jgi:hypothetical protein
MAGAGPQHDALIHSLTRRGFLQRAGALGLGAVIASAGPFARPDLAWGEPSVADGTLQAFADTMIPGRQAARTDLGNEIHPRAIAGVDSEPGAVEADALALYHHPLIGFDSLEGPFLTELSTRSLQQGGDFLSLDFDRRVKVCLSGLAFDNSSRVLWEAAAAVPFTAFCAAGMIPDATSERASGLRVMGLPGTAPRGYADFSYFRRLARERTRSGFLH